MTDQPGTGAEPLRPVVGGRVGGRVSLWNVANAVTVVRLVLVPCFAALLFLPGDGWRFAALAVFVIASLTDRLDGELARRYGLVTDFGKIADPIADKALTGSALVGLSLLGELPWWVTVLIMGREIGVTLLRFAVLRHGVIPASWGGKIKTVLQVLAISLYLLPGVPEVLRWLTMGAAVLVTTATGLDYVVRAVRLRRAATRARTAEGAPPPGRRRGRPPRRRRGRQVVIGSVVGMPVAMEMLSDKGLRDASARALELLVKAGRTVAVAESITAGMIGAALTAPAGASAAFRGGVIAYATELKHRLLAVPADLLEREGAVDPRVAAAMATGVRGLTGADYGLAVTGVAGPDPQDGKPVGTVHIAVCGPGDRLWHRDPVLTGDRAEIRLQVVRESVDLLCDVLESRSENEFV